MEDKSPQMIEANEAIKGAFNEKLAVEVALGESLSRSIDLPPEGDCDAAQAHSVEEALFEADGVKIPPVEDHLAQTQSQSAPTCDHSEEAAVVRADGGCGEDSEDGMPSETEIKSNKRLREGEMEQYCDEGGVKIDASESNEGKEVISDTLIVNEVKIEEIVQRVYDRITLNTGRSLNCNELFMMPADLTELGEPLDINEVMQREKESIEKMSL
eukprot:GHVN01056981.1.p1 GENE.GHVN01056981.1~~GHVN01056981.1.p1  ORF type:complete len:214 (-),score=57.11 GHVN01056981.1:222-863(-)